MFEKGPASQKNNVLSVTVFILILIIGGAFFYFSNPGTIKAPAPQAENSAAPTSATVEPATSSELSPSPSANPTPAAPATNPQTSPTPAPQAQTPQTQPSVSPANPPAVNPLPSANPASSAAPSGHELVKTCTTEMATVFHIHQHVVILIEGQPVLIPANIGIDVAKNCMSPIHTHEAGGILHVESPVQADFTLGDFFYNWKMPFNKNVFANYKVDKDHGMKFYVNGVESQQFENLVLQEHQEIVIDYYKLSDGPDQLPPPYKW